MDKRLLKDYRSLLAEKETAEKLLKSIRLKADKDKSEMRRLSLMETKVNNLKKKVMRETLEVTRFIEKCDSAYIREILILRYLRGYSWNKVSFTMGGINSPDSLRKMAVRYIDKVNKK